MARGERNCIVCNTVYHYCETCGDNRAIRKQTWRNLYCSENCKNVFEILSNYAFKHITASEAKKKLEKFDLSRRDNFRKDFKMQLAAIDAVAANEEKAVVEVETEKPKPNETKEEFRKKDRDKDKDSKPVFNKR